MILLISPAKRMVEDPDGLPPEGAPQFLPQAERLAAALRAMTPRQLQTLWRCSDAVARQSLEQMEALDLRRRLTPALLAYRGIQYQYLAPNVLETGQLDYLRPRLRIVSGLYGLLRPFDGVAPYRLEMQARLAVDGCRDLYGFWGGRLAGALVAETDCVVDLASQEYSRAVTPHLPPTVRREVCTFGELCGGRVVEKGVRCKMARGRMVRWAAARRAETPEALRDFDELHYRLDPDRSDDNHLIFLQGGT